MPLTCVNGWMEGGGDFHVDEVHRLLSLPCVMQNTHRSPCVQLNIFISYTLHHLSKGDHRTTKLSYPAQTVEGLVGMYDTVDSNDVRKIAKLMNRYPSFRYIIFFQGKQNIYNYIVLTCMILIYLILYTLFRPILDNRHVIR